MLDSRATALFQQLTADVEWQAGLTPTQRATAMTFAQGWVVAALQAESDADLACRQARETLRHLANLVRQPPAYLQTEPR